MSGITLIRHYYLDLHILTIELDQISGGPFSDKVGSSQSSKRTEKDVLAALFLVDDDETAYANNGYTGVENPHIAVKSEAVNVI